MPRCCRPCCHHVLRHHCHFHRHCDRQCCERQCGPRRPYRRWPESPHSAAVGAEQVADLALRWSVRFWRDRRHLPQSPQPLGFPPWASSAGRVLPPPSLVPSPRPLAALYGFHPLAPEVPTGRRSTRRGHLILAWAQGRFGAWEPRGQHSSALAWGDGPRLAAHPQTGGVHWGVHGRPSPSLILPSRLRVPKTALHSAPASMSLRAAAAPSPATAAA